MAIFSGKIVDAYYTDEILSNVTILYNYEKDGDTLVGQYNLVVDETEEQFQDLLKEWSYADIEIATIELNKEIINKKTIKSLYLKNKDKIEIVHFIGGG